MTFVQRGQQLCAPLAHDIVWQRREMMEYAYLNSSETRKVMDAEYAELSKLLIDLGPVK